MNNRISIALLIVVAVFFIGEAYAQEPNFLASSLTAQDVDCKKCHPDTPHVIHAARPVDCVACHGDKLSVSIPQCTKCHSGPIHKVHEGKVNTQACSYCHTTIQDVHNNLNRDAVCSHCHADLIGVHGTESSCVKCHRSPPEIVKPVKTAEMTLICQNCHAQPSVAAIHGEAEDKEGCYTCHAGTSKATGSEVPHLIHATKVDCAGCHQENQQVIIPRCTRCHNIDTLHAFNKIGMLTPQSGLLCEACHQEAKPTEAPQAQATTPKPAEAAPQEMIGPVSTPEPEENGFKAIPGLSAVLAAGVLFTGYILIRRERK